MAAVTSQSIVNTGTTPAPITCAASDTIASGQFGSNGIAMRMITSGTIITVTIGDPGTTASGNPASGSPAGRAVVMPATGVRMIFVPLSAIDPATGNATLSFSPTTGGTYELYRV
jgi:hypothetical protein